MTDEKRHPIQVVVRRTGLTADVLRAWERRYAAVEPRRSRGGRRLYSDADIERLRLLKRAAAAGRSIGQIASLATDRLAALVREDETQDAGEATPARPRAPSAAARHVEQALAAVTDLDAARLRVVLSRAAVALTAEEFLEQVMEVVLQRIGAGWHAGELGIAHEHLASSVVNHVLGTMVSSASGRDAAPAIVVATPSGERHELGAMMAAAAAAAAGWKVVYLGADAPADSIVMAADRHAPRVVALSVIHPQPGADITREVELLRERLPKDVTLAVGGSGITPALERAGAVRVSDLPGFRAFLDKLADGGSAR
jgi:methanogenic corrinoid protein MtbC1